MKTIPKQATIQSRSEKLLVMGANEREMEVF